MEGGSRRFYEDGAVHIFNYTCDFDLAALRFNKASLENDELKRVSLDLKGYRCRIGDT